MAFVVDASVSLAWAFPDESDDYATRVLARLKDEEAISTSIWPLEVANAVVTAERHGRIDEAVRANMTAVLAHDAPALVLFDTTQALGVIADLARAHRLSSYDASYLYLAMREGLALATMDKGLRAAATAVGVPLVD